MKKFMKAIAFATVMCMLLSVAAFADDLTITDASTVAVEVTGATANAQIAFVVTTEDAVADIASANIKDVAQTAIDGSGNASITLGTGDAEEVYIFYGYQGVGEAQWFKAAKATPGDTVLVTVVDILDDAEIKAYTSETEGFELPSTDNDKAGAIIAKVDVDANGKTVTDMIWSIRHNGLGNVSYVKADTTLFTVLDGAVQIGLAFANGNNTGTEELAISGLHAIVKLSDDSVIFSDEAFDAPNGPQAQN